MNDDLERPTSAPSAGARSAGAGSTPEPATPSRLRGTSVSGTPSSLAALIITGTGDVFAPGGELAGRRDERELDVAVLGGTDVLPVNADYGLVDEATFAASIRSAEMAEALSRVHRDAVTGGAVPDRVAAVTASGAVRLELPPEAEPFRSEARAWLADNPSPSARQLADAGYVAPHWPPPWGRDASPLKQLAIDAELRAAGVRRPFNPVGIGWAGPTILLNGTPEQQRRWLPGILDGSELWCQLFSEPEAGSDLARLRTRAGRDGDEWVVNGQKLWPGLAEVARYGILLARTDPDAPKHRGITYFVCPMDRPGIDVRPLVSMTGESEFNEVFFTDVRLPGDCVVGEVGRGWDLAKVTLANERVGLATAGAFWGGRPTVDDLVELIGARGGLADPVWRQEVAAVWSEWRILEVLGARMAAAAIHGRPPGPDASVRKALSDRHGQRLLRLGRDLAGAHGLLADAGPFGVTGGRWTFGFLFSPALTIGGGTAEVQRNVIGERILGLPREPDADADRPWSELAGGR